MTATYKEMASKLLPHLFDRYPMLSFVSKMMNKLATGISKEAICSDTPGPND